MQTGYKELKRKSNYENKYSGRNIPIGLKIKIIFVHFMMFFGLTFMGMGLLTTVIFGSLVDFQSFKFNENSPTIEGQIDNVEPTNTTINNARVIKYYYSFTLPTGEKYSGESFSTRNLQNDKNVIIQYIENDPTIARIQGTSNGEVDFWVLFITLPFVFIGFMFVFIRLKKGIQSVYLLQYGEIAYGVLIEKSPTSTRVNNQMVYKLVFEFEANDGVLYKAVAKTHKTADLEDEEREKLVYDTKNPAKSVMIDELPRSVKRFFQNE